MLSIAADRPIDMILEDHVFSTSLGGLDFNFPTIMYLPNCKGLLCELDTADDHLSAAAPPVPTVTLVLKGGRPLASVPEYPALLDSSDEQTDPDTLLEQEDKAVQTFLLSSS